MTPELRAHVDEFAADVAADVQYRGKHRLDHPSVRVAELVARCEPVRRQRRREAALTQVLEAALTQILTGVPSDANTFKAPAVAAHTVTAGVPQAGRPPTAPGTAGPGLDSAQTRASTQDGRA